MLVDLVLKGFVSAHVLCRYYPCVVFVLPTCDDGGTCGKLSIELAKPTLPALSGMRREMGGDTCSHAATGPSAERVARFRARSSACIQGKRRRILICVTYRHQCCNTLDRTLGPSFGSLLWAPPESGRQQWLTCWSESGWAGSPGWWRWLGIGADRRGVPPFSGRPHMSRSLSPTLLAKVSSSWTTPEPCRRARKRELM